MKTKTIAFRVALVCIFAASLGSPAAAADHLATPKSVHGLYIGIGDAISSKFLDRVQIYQKHGINTLVIDIRSSGSSLLVISDAKTATLVQKLHEKHIYVVARIIAFEGNRKWYDPSSQERWKTIASVSLRAAALGFDEINYDYVRYGSVNEPGSATPVAERISVIEKFFRFLREEVANKADVPISCDLFGIILLTSQKSIGQNVEIAAKNFDYVCPMSYPSHWSAGSFGFDNPAHHPYETVKKNLAPWQKTSATAGSRAKLRVWIQAFGLDSHMRPYFYGAKEIQDQIRAAEEAGASGWMLWNARCNYPESIFQK